MQRPEFEHYLARQIGVSAINWADQREAIGNLAKCTKFYYDALVHEGFLPDAALRIVLAHGCWPKMTPSRPPSTEETSPDDDH